jgi:hypothetical protein
MDGGRTKRKEDMEGEAMNVRDMKVGARVVVSHTAGTMFAGHTGKIIEVSKRYRGVKRWCLVHVNRIDVRFFPSVLILLNGLEDRTPNRRAKR